jgi:signal transduction histidine kinase
MLILLAMIGFSYFILERTRDATEEVLATREIRGALLDLFSVLQDAETGQRGYLLTGEDRYRAPYDQAVSKVDQRFANVQEVMRRRDASSDDFLVQFKAAIDAKLGELSRTVELKSAGRVDEAMEVVRSDTGKDLMDRIRELIKAKRDTVEQRLNAAVARQRDNAAILQWSIIGGGLLMILAGTGVAWTLSRYTREIVKARTEVEAVNSGLELRVQERTADLQRANEEVQRFAYIVSHDLRAPLVNVMGFTAELKTSLESLRAVTADEGFDQLPSAEAARAAVETDVPEAISFIQASTKKMDALINAILKLSREGRRTLNPEAIDLTALFAGISASVQHQFVDAGGEMVVEGPLPTIISDRLALEQVFGNLVDNAVKYQATGRPPVVHVKARPSRDGSIFVEVEDNGRGIAAADFDRVFDLFRRAGAQDKPGEGIGLAHVRALVRRMGGDITLTSEIGKGTTFQVKLPRNIRTVLERAGELRG